MEIKKIGILLCAAIAGGVPSLWYVMSMHEQIELRASVCSNQFSLDINPPKAGDVLPNPHPPPKKASDEPAARHGVVAE